MDRLPPPAWAAVARAAIPASPPLPPPNPRGATGRAPGRLIFAIFFCSIAIWNL